MIRVLVADDHAALRAGLAALISMEPDMDVVAQAGTGEEALQLYRELLPDVVTMDLKMPGRGGNSAIESLCKAYEGAKVLVISSMDGDEQIYRALKAGALGYLLKDAAGDEIVAAVRSTYRGKRTLATTVGAAIATRLIQEPLSARELEVLRGAAQGKSNKEIGEVIGLTENSVKGYLKTIAFKLGTDDRTSAVVTAMKRGLLQLDEI